MQTILVLLNQIEAFIAQFFGLANILMQLYKIKALIVLYLYSAIILVAIKNLKPKL